MQGLSLSEWEGIVTVSGDGLLYEVEPHPNPALGVTEEGGQDPVSPIPTAGAEWAP